MTRYKKLSRDEHFRSPGPKRILALDGGGLRGILTLGFLGRIESELRQRHGGDDDFRLAHYFDLIAGTSTGAIIAASLACGFAIEELTRLYMKLGREVFEKSLFRQGLLRARYDERKLVAQLKAVLGAETKLGSPELLTGLLVVTKRLDTGSPWPLGNNPAGSYFEAPDSAWIPNKDYPLWQVVRASTAAPVFFDPQPMTIAEQEGRTTQAGSFVDGGVSPHNNPALQALMYATLKGYKVGWKTGAEDLLIVSVGSGSRDPAITPIKLTAGQAVQSLVALMDDSSALIETLMQWMSESPTARKIDSEIGNLAGETLGGNPLFTYLRYNFELTPERVLELLPEFPARKVDSLTAMDDPGNMETLRTLGELAAERTVESGHFPQRFNLTSGS